MALSDSQTIPENDIIRETKNVVDFNAGLLLKDGTATESGLTLAAQNGEESIEVDLTEFFVTRAEYEESTDVPPASETGSGRIGIVSDAEVQAGLTVNANADDTKALTLAKLLLSLGILGIPRFDLDGGDDGQALVMEILGGQLTIKPGSAIGNLLRLIQTSSNEELILSREALNFGLENLHRFELAAELLLIGKNRAALKESISDNYLAVDQQGVNTNAGQLTADKAATLLRTLALKVLPVATSPGSVIVGIPGATQIEAKARPLPDFAADVQPYFDFVDLANKIRPLLTGETIPGDAREVKGIFCFNTPLATSGEVAFNSVAGLRALSLSAAKTPKIIHITDARKQGAFVFDSTDTTSTDNTGTILVTGSGCRYKRVITGGNYQLDWYGAVGDGTANDTAAVQAAINDALKATDIVANGEFPKYKGNPGTLLVPVGTFKVNALTVAGSIRIIGQGGGTYAGSTFLQGTEGINMVLLAADADGLSQSTVFENICFKSVSATSTSGVAQIKTASGINSNSVYIRNCWFKTPEENAIWLTQGDDIQISGCTFDVCPFNAIVLGNTGTPVSNARILNNTFYQVARAHIKLLGVIGTTILGNSAYNSGSPISTSIFIDGNADRIDGLTVTGNEINAVTAFSIIPTLALSLVISSNTLLNVPGPFVSIIGGGILYGASIIGNSMKAAGAFGSPPITGATCGVQGCSIMGNTFFAGATTALGIDLSDSRVYGNVIAHNPMLNITSADNIAAPTANGIIRLDETMTLAAGDLLYHDGTLLTRLPKGSDGQILSIVSGELTWVTP